MPLYEYRCRACGKLTEIRHGFKEAISQSCDCGGELTRVFNPAGIVFKGSGFYVNDSRKGGGEKSAPDGGPSTPAASKPAEPAASSSSDTGSGAASAPAAPAVTSKPGDAAA
ncbi:MAG: hypothetical protein GIW95_02315 [Candidatus Eremiobacteraeota bacterium]|nr:hypothetical protein [Candidatus Eremiobacteraeota bacterium]